MLQRYEASYDHGIMKWLGEQPPDIEARVIVTILPDKISASALKMPHQISRRITGKGRLLGDIISPAASEED